MLEISSTIIAWKSKSLPNEIIKPPVTSDNSLNSSICYNNSVKIRVKFDGSCLKQDKVTFTPKAILNFYFVSEVILWPYYVVTDFPLENSLFRAFKLIKNADPDKYSYSECGIGFDARGKFSMSNGDWFSKNAIIFGVHNSSFTHVCNRKEDILILGISLTDGLDDTTITAKAYYSISFREQQEKKSTLQRN